MVRRLFTTAFMGMLALSTMGRQLHAQQRTWTNAIGQTLEAEFVRIVQDKVFLKDASGATKGYQFDTFGIADYEFVRATIAQQPTTWKDSTGKFSLEGATFQGLDQDDIVTLKLPAGPTKVALSKLSVNDQKLAKFLAAGMPQKSHRTVLKYAAGQGPGIIVVGSGSFKLYLNGRLLVTDAQGGKPQFIPMTFLPGKNVVAVDAVKGAAAQGVLVQIDELERSYVSGAGWKVTSKPSAQWLSAAYDDSGWEAAAETGSVQASPVERLPDKVLEPAAKWIWSPRADDQQVALRYTFTIRAEGFAHNVIGGEGGRMVVVKSVDEIVQLVQSSERLIIVIPEGVYDFRQKTKVMAAANPNDANDPSKGVSYRLVYGEGLLGRDPGAAMVEVERWNRVLWVGSDKTILGMGRGAHLRGASFYVSSPAKNVIFRNLCIFDVNPHLIEAGDGVEGVGCDGLWVDHCTFRWISDGNDMSGDNPGCRAVTFSWVHYSGANQWTIAGRDHFAALIINSEVTYHHMWWDTVNGRAPKAADKQTKIHVYNNYYTDNTYHEVGASEGAQVLLEGSNFQDVFIATMRESGGLIQSRNNIFVNVKEHRLNDVNGPEPKDNVFTPPYEYELDPPAAVPALLRSRAGAGGKWGEPPVY